MSMLQKRKIATLPMNNKEVYIERGPDGFGFGIMGDSIPNSVFVSRVAPGSPAARAGSIVVGDQVIEINDHNTEWCTHGKDPV